MKIIRKIQFTGKNLNDVFALPCVSKIIKIQGEPWLVLDEVRNITDSNVVIIGETLVEYEDETWGVEK